MSLLELKQITKIYPVEPPIAALRGVDLQVEFGERVAVLGRSGSGKSTLLNIIGLLDDATSGTYRLAGRDVSAFTSRERDRLRAGLLGFVFQESHVIGHRSVEENMWIGLMAAGVPRGDRAVMIERALATVNMRHRARSPGRLLSGGEKQRLAVARAVVTNPRVLLADEPTGNLDDANASAVLELFDQQAGAGVAVLVITHDDRITRWADRTVYLADGQIAGLPVGRSR